MRRLTWSLLFTFVICPALLGAATMHSVDSELRRRLIAAVGKKEGFKDRFQAEVWMVDMENRLKNLVPNLKERLTILRLVHQEATQAKLPPALVLAVIDVESDFDRFAISKAGARGLMQIMPFWLEEIDHENDNLFNISTNLRFGCTILRYYLDWEKGNLTRALARYNGSTGKTWYPNRVYKALRRWQ